MSKKAIVIIGPDFEEIEAITPVDLLRRANVEVSIVTTEKKGQPLKGRSNIEILPDMDLQDCVGKVFDAIIIPGGPGVKNLKNDQRILKMLQQQHKDHRLIAAICAAPLLLHQAGLLNDVRYTAHISTHDVLSRPVPNAPWVLHRQILTSPGAGTAVAFALKLVEILTTPALANKIKQSISVL